MVHRFVRDESGMTMGLVVIMVVLIGVMGAGLLTFVSNDLTTVVETNRGQRAFEMADAGIKAAAKQLSDVNSNPNAYGGSDGSTGDIQWAVSQGGKCLPSLDGTPCPSPSAFPSSGANVQIQADVPSPEKFTVVSEGRDGGTRRRVEAVFTLRPAGVLPLAWMTRGNIVLTGNASPTGISFFALKDAYREGSFSLGNEVDKYYGKWAATSGAGPYPNAFDSYPNDYNRTPRGSGLSGIGAQGHIYDTSELVFEGSRSYDSSPPLLLGTPRVVPDYNASTLPDSQKIAFPFKVATPAEDREMINQLRDRALELEQANPGNTCPSDCYYMDSNPGNGFNDAGLSTNADVTINSWYTVSDYTTVRFYEYQSYSNQNDVTYGANPIPNCTSTTPPKGVIMVQNGDLTFNGNRRFSGAIIVRAYDASGNLLPPPTTSSSTENGSFIGEGGACLEGFANSSGNMRIAGGINPGAVPDLNSIGLFKQPVHMDSWRELYE